MTSASSSIDSATPGATPLAALASLRFDGPEAASFLHAQLASDVGSLAPGRLQRSCYLSPKGRVLANLVLWRGAGEGGPIGALVAADLAASIARRLSMFVLRAKVKVVDPGPARERLGFAGAGAAAALRSFAGRAPGA